MPERPFPPNGRCASAPDMQSVTLIIPTRTRSRSTAAELDAVLDQVQGWRETVRTTTWTVPRRDEPGPGPGGC